VIKLLLFIALPKIPTKLHSDLPRSFYSLSHFIITVEGELGVAGSLINFFKDCGVGLLWLVWLCRYMY